MQFFEQREQVESRLKKSKIPRGTYLSHSYDVERVKITMFYPFPAILREFGISRTTLQRWRKDGRLVCHSKHPTLVRGDYLIMALKNEVTV